jgi:cell division protein FtsN
MQMYCNKKFCCLVFSIFAYAFTYGQDNASLVLADTASKNKLPVIGLGFGISPYFGNVGYSGFSDPLRNKMAFGFSVEERLRNHFTVSYEFLYGKLYGNDKSVYAHNNFQANMISNAFTFNYYPLEGPRFLKPYILFGIGALYYKTYIDKFDANNISYNYWSDNTIRTLSENAPNAQSAVITARDYSYETKANNGAFAMTLPIGIGVNFKISPKLSINIGPTIYYTFTKNIDNVPSAKTGLGYNDRFVYASFSFRYDLGAKEYRNPDDAKYADVNFLALENADTDGDGVVDKKDKCPNTPVQVKVDMHGCPLDGDKDGVPDYKDKELNSKSGAVVDEEGIELTDAYIEKKEANRIIQDSLDALKPHTEFRIPEPGQPESYIVQLGTFKNGVPPELLDKFLTVPDVKTVMGEDSMVTYSIGPFTDISVAENKKKELVNNGIKEAFVTGYDKDGKEVDIEKYLPSNQGFYITQTSENSTKDTAAKVINEAATKIKYEDKGVAAGDTLAASVKNVKRPSNGNNRMMYKVQLGAFSKSTNPNVFSGIKDLSNERQPNGTTRYFAGAFASKEEANKYRDKVRKNGFETAFTVAFKDEAPIVPVEAKEEEGADVSIPDNIVFKVQLGAFRDSVAAEKMKGLEGVKKEQIEGSPLTRYLIGSYKSFEEAFAEKEKIKQSDEFKGAYVVAYKGKKRVKLSQTIPARIQEEVAKSAYKKAPASQRKLENIQFKIQLGIFRSEVPADILAVYTTLKDVAESKTPSGMTRYTSGTFKDFAAANAYKDEVITKGVKGAFVIAFEGDKYIPLQEAIDATSKP